MEKCGVWNTASRGAQSGVTKEGARPVTVERVPRHPCGVCKKPTYRTPKERQRSKSGFVFCSVPCAMSWKIGKPTAKRRGGSDVACPQCDQIKFHSAEKMRRGGNHFCSTKCSHKYRWGAARMKALRCEICRKPFNRQLNQILRNKKAVTCSRECYGKWRSANLSGENSPQWKGGVTHSYGGSNWRSQRNKALRRDGYQCVDCGKAKQKHGYKMDVHHIVHYNRYKNKDRANRLENLVSLCRGCHMKRHKKQSVNNA